MKIKAFWGIMGLKATYSFEPVQTVRMCRQILLYTSDKGWSLLNPNGFIKVNFTCDHVLLYQTGGHSWDLHSLFLTCFCSATQFFLGTLLYSVLDIFCRQYILRFWWPSLQNLWHVLHGSPNHLKIELRIINSSNFQSYCYKAKQ
jgi:hypothetical protein